MPETRSCLPRLACAMGGALCAACGLVLGVSDYSVESSDADAAAPVEPPPELPALDAVPDERQGECLACAEETCDAERAACVADPVCEGMLRCHGECDDPACMAKCRDEHGDPLLFSDYFLCVFGSVKEGAPADGCVTACGGGDQWACIEGYSWDAPSTGPFVLDLSIVAENSISINPPLNGIAGADVAWCPEPNTVNPRSPDEECAGWSTTDGYGQAQIRHTNEVRVLALTSRFAGMQAQLYVRPVRRSTALEVRIEPTPSLRLSVGPQLTEQSGSPIDQSLGTVSVIVTDCLGQLAPARVELERASADTIGCPYKENGCDTSLTGSARWAFFNVPRGSSIDVVARPLDDDSELSRRTVFLYEGWDAQVTLYPRPSQ